MLGWFQDDFFYYLKVAQYIATTGVSTFNGLYLTNGYHPLWMLVLVILCRFFHGTPLFLAVQAVSLASAVWTYLLLRRILCLLLPSATARAGAFLIALEALLLIRYGMEVTLTLPLALLLCLLLLRNGAPMTFRAAAGLGVLASLVILSRLDAGLFVATLCFALLLPPVSLWRRPAVIAGFMCGVAPLLVIYFAVNVHFFHLLTPVSGLSKQLQSGLALAPLPWRGIFPVDRMRQYAVLPELVLIALGLLACVATMLAPSRRTAALANRVQWRTLLVLLLFPTVHMVTLSMLSDWPVWPWYFYSITLAAAAGFAMLAQWLPRVVAVTLAVLYAGVLTGYTAEYVIHGPSSVYVAESSRLVATYMDAHPGVYLMGDQAGTTAWLSHQPIIQTEGLVMDRDFLLKMKSATPLQTVARDYHARYYVLIGAFMRPDGCAQGMEPQNGGPGTPRMLGVICHAPLATYVRQNDGAVIRISDANWIEPQH